MSTTESKHTLEAGTGTGQGQGVMTLRQYLAANAPKVPWDTFVVEMPPRPARRYQAGFGPGEVDPDVVALTPESAEEQDFYKRELQEKRLRLWPWYYADSVIRGGVEYDRLKMPPG